MRRRSARITRTLTLQPATDYVLSAYLWNMGDSVNHVTTVIDMNDAPGEPQITLAYGNANADQGYFAYRSFNTTNTGTTVTLRVFYDGLAGTGAAANYFPLAAQWDNIAITKAANFIPPQAGGNLRPLVSLTNLPDGANILLETVPAVLPLIASATDYDGTITKVEFYAGTTLVRPGYRQPLHRAVDQPALRRLPVDGSGDGQRRRHNRLCARWRFHLHRAPAGPADHRPRREPTFRFPGPLRPPPHPFNPPRTRSRRPIGELVTNTPAAQQRPIQRHRLQCRRTAVLPARARRWTPAP